MINLQKQTRSTLQRTRSDSWSSHEMIYAMNSRFSHILFLIVRFSFNFHLGKWQCK